MAASSIPTATEGYKFTWTVTNASLGLLHNEEHIYSPEFPTNFFSSKWTFCLRFTIYEASLRVYIRRNFDEGPKAVCVYLKDLKLWKLLDSIPLTEDQPFKLTFLKGECCELFKIKYDRNDLLRCSFEPNVDRLCVSCSLCSSAFCSANILQLSEDMKTLFKNADLYDAVLRSSDGETKIHRAIFEARVKGLKFQGKRKREGDILQLSGGAKDNVVEGIFHYLYSAQMDGECSLTEEFLKGAAKHEMGITNFETKFSKVQSERDACTKLMCKRKCIRLTLDKSNSESIHERLFFLHDTEWHFELHFSSDDSQENVTIFVTSIKCLSHMNIEKDLQIRFVVALQDFCGSNMVSRIIYAKMDRTDDIFVGAMIEFNLKYSKEGNDSVTETSSLRKLVFCMEMWNGKSNVIPEATGTDNTVSNILILSEDLLHMFENSLYTDAVVLLPDGNLKVHRSILKARSPVFARMFPANMKMKKSGKIVVEDINTSTMTMLLRYMYGALLDLGSTDEAIHLAYAADKYELINLRDQCLYYLLQNVSKDTALRVYVVLDFFHAENWKNELKILIRGSYYGSSSTALREFQQLRPHLFEEIFPGRTLFGDLEYREMKRD